MLLLLCHKARGNIINPWSSPMIVERDSYSENGTPWMIFKQDDAWQTIVTESEKLIKDIKYFYVIMRLKKISASKNSIVRVAVIKWEFCSNDSNGGLGTPLLSLSSSLVSENAATSSEGVIKDGGV
ncbi:hypothetical protein M9H77_28030 [Catharanthus roseus]|uniref:Uncharacterized protein n=1 Tax=Catharanthus roseus TaxID=4058 RepID=A0ACC0AGV4_CATRO|nr:hypothetical protein M9H77_28030 [Catharanthus roseus]